MKQQIISLLEGKKKEKSKLTTHEQTWYYIDGYNQGIDTAIESVDEIIEMLVKEIEKIDVSGGGSGRRLKEQLLNLVK